MTDAGPSDDASLAISRDKFILDALVDLKLVDREKDIKPLIEVGQSVDLSVASRCRCSCLFCRCCCFV